MTTMTTGIAAADALDAEADLLQRLSEQIDRTALRLYDLASDRQRGRDSRRALRDRAMASDGEIPRLLGEATAIRRRASHERLCAGVEPIEIGLRIADGRISFSLSR